MPRQRQQTAGPSGRIANVRHPARHPLGVAIAALVLAIAFAMPGVAEEPAAAPRQATGKFEGKVWTLELVGAYAFPADKVGFDDEPGFKVAVSNGSFDAAHLDRYLDREAWIDARFANDERLVIYFQFAKDGAYRGLTYYFGSGDGCGFCLDGSVQSTVKIAGGRLRGRLLSPPKPDEISFDFEVDVPVAPAEPGKRLTGDGGELAKVYAAYHQALLDQNADLVATFLTERNRTRYMEAKEEGLQAWYKDHPAVKYKIVRAYAQGDQALLLVDGAVSYSNVLVEVLFEKEGGVYKIYDEVLKVTAGVP